MPVDSPAQSLEINYLKSNAYREAACDGALGGPTPQKKLWIAFYTERFPIPRIAEYNVVPASKAGSFQLDTSTPPTIVEGRKGIIRNIEFGLYLSLEAAEQLHGWLTSQISSMKAEDEQ